MPNLDVPTMSADQLQAGRMRLARPVLPLARLVEILFLSGPFATAAEVLAELNEPIETAAIRYPAPAATLTPHLDLLGEFERLKDPRPASYTVLAPDGETLPLLEAVEAWVAQKILTRELEAINSLLCGPGGCALCCQGPTADMRQDFFAIPLSAAEVGLFPLPCHDSPASRRLTADSEPPLAVAGRPFFAAPAGLYHWRDGWGMILPRCTSCPQLGADGVCAIYPQRPQVCRRPQIFAYRLEQAAREVAETVTVWVERGKLLAVWDCPYVRALRPEIAAYAEACELEPIFKENKA